MRSIHGQLSTRLLLLASLLGTARGARGGGGSGATSGAPEALFPRLTLTTGILRGAHVDGGKLSRFLGVPFAAPPVGVLRWQPPAPPSNWSGVRNALTYGNSCVQDSSSFFADFSKVLGSYES